MSSKSHGIKYHGKTLQGKTYCRPTNYAYRDTLWAKFPSEITCMTCKGTAIYLRELTIEFSETTKTSFY